MDNPRSWKARGISVGTRAAPNPVHELSAHLWLTQDHTSMGETPGRPAAAQRPEPTLSPVLHQETRVSTGVKPLSLQFQLKH